MSNVLISQFAILHPIPLTCYTVNHLGIAGAIR